VARNGGSCLFGDLAPAPESACSPQCMVHLLKHIGAFIGCILTTVPQLSSRLQLCVKTSSLMTPEVRALGQVMLVPSPEVSTNSPILRCWCSFWWDPHGDMASSAALCPHDLKWVNTLALSVLLSFPASWYCEGKVRSLHTAAWPCVRRAPWCLHQVCSLAGWSRASFPLFALELKFLWKEKAPLCQ
jgi:hypothetical protein